MTDDEFKAAVMARFDAIGAEVGAVRETVAETRVDFAAIRETVTETREDFVAIREAVLETQKDVGALRRQASAIVARLEEQDNLFDQVFRGQRTLQIQVADLASASQQSLDSLRSLAQRVIRLEHPDADI